MECIKIKDFKIKSEDIFIVDTNVWIFLLGNHIFPINSNQVASYSQLIDQIKEKGNKIVILSLGISELFNRYMRESGRVYLNFKNIVAKDAYKKYYRDTDQYNRDKSFIIDNIKDNILNIAEVISDNFEEIEIDKILDKNRNNYDFNDNYYARIAEKFGYKIITHDNDFIKNYKDLNFTVITNL